jgi:tRNA (uracil-5-)-methyltransferase
MNSLDNQKTIITECHIPDVKIQKMMGVLLETIQTSHILSHKLFAVEFLSSLYYPQLLVALIYHKPLDGLWEQEAYKLLDLQDLFIIGRSRKKKIILRQDYIPCKVKTALGDFEYMQHEGSFSQPNGVMNEKMIDWVLSNIDAHNKEDLLELYCGAGNFTLPLSRLFNKVLATEISKTSIRSAKQNCLINSIENISFVKMSAEEITSALNFEREFIRLRGIDLKSYDFSHIFVDPPRSGLDPKSTLLVQKFDHIIYISCNQETLKRDLQILTQTHDIERFAIFDQFAHTPHIESGAILIKKQ